METQTNSPYEALTKAANPLPATAQQYQQMASQRMVDMILAALGAGVLTRGAIGATRFMGNLGRKAPRPSPYAQQIDIPGLARERDEEEKVASTQFREGWTGDIARWLYENLMKGDGFMQGGGVARNLWEIPAVGAFGLPAAALAGAAGYKGTDAILDWRRKSEKKKELADAQREYEDVIRQSFSKQSNEELLDEIADAIFEKEAGAGELIRRGAQTATGAYGGAALLAALLSGKLTYDWFRKRDEQAVTEEAMRRRARQRAGGLPPAHFTLEPQPQ